MDLISVVKFGLGAVAEFGVSPYVKSATMLLEKAAPDLFKNAARTEIGRFVIQKGAEIAVYAGAAMVVDETVEQIETVREAIKDAKQKAESESNAEQAE